MSDYPWFRFYNEALNDPKLKRIVILTKQPKALINGVWVGLLCLASESPVRGELLISENMPYLMEEIIEVVGVDYEIGELIIDHLIKLEMVSLVDGVYLITRWAERQPKSDNSTERVRRHRAKKAKETSRNNSNGSEKQECNVTETLQETECNVIDIDKDKDLNTTTTTAPACEESQNEFGKICTLLAQGGLYLDGFTSQLVQDCYDDIAPPPGESRVNWFEYALAETAGSRRNWKYLETIVRNVNEAGGLSAHKANRASQKSKPNGAKSYASNSKVPIGLQNSPATPTSREVYDPATGETYTVVYQ